MIEMNTWELQRYTHTYTIKECARSHCQSITYCSIIKLIVKLSVESSVHNRNSFQTNNGISKSVYPTMIMEGIPKLDLNKKMILFGTDELAYIGTSNTIISRATTAVALMISNDVGGQYSMCIHTGKHIHMYIWNELPINKYVIERVERLAEDEGFSVP